MRTWATGSISMPMYSPDAVRCQPKRPNRKMRVIIRIRGMLGAVEK